MWRAEALNPQVRLLTGCALIQVCLFSFTMAGACCQSLMNSVLSVKITVRVWCALLRLGWVRKLQTLKSHYQTISCTDLTAIGMVVEY